MPERKGRCTNFGNCTVADNRQIVNVPETSDFVCSSCSKQLTEIPSARKTPFVPIIVGVALVSFVLVLVWLRLGGHDTTPPVGPTSEPTAAVILRLHGSNTIGAQLAPALAEAFLKTEGATDVRIVPGHGEETTITGVLPGESSPKVVEVEARGSSTGFADLAQDRCDIAMASRKVNASEAAGLSKLGDMSSPSCEHILGLDGVAIIVNRANPVSSLTKDQVAGIFTGKITNWKQVLSARDTIRVYALDSNSGTYDTFRSLVLGSGSLVSNAGRFADNRELSDKVASDPDAIGFVDLPYVLNAKSVALSEGGSKPLFPTRMTVATEDYLLSRRLYLYTPSTPANQLTSKFVGFALSKAGQDIVGDSGFVPQNLQSEPTSVASDSPFEYRRLTRGHDRMTVNFRFRTGSSDLDNKGLQDLDRVVTFLSDLRFSGQNVILIGFADSTGTDAVNIALSKKRARAVAEQFAPRGLTPAVVTGFGSALPVASNDRIEGREKNRRVEVWLKR